ncbi:MAG: tripartite tricarboxylate transporter TctB family protein [Firmicutes bacterium]|nr:tripartite tricarboxylate transporter TctB family protein [Bacillota bacterium]
MKKSDICVVAFMYGVCALFFSMTLKLKPAAQIYPKFVISLLAVLTTLYVIKMVMDAKKYGVQNGFDEVFAGFQAQQFFKVVVMILAFVVMLKVFGFYIAAAVFMLVTLYLLKVPKLHNVIATVVIIAIVYFAFTEFLGVRLPKGMFF